MKRRNLALIGLGALVLMAPVTLGQAPGGPGPDRMGPGGEDRPPMPPPRDPVMDMVRTLGELNLRPDFNLTVAQKTQLAAILKEGRTARRGNLGPPDTSPANGGGPSTQPTDGPRPRFRPAGRGAQEVLAKIKGVLTADQWATVEAAMKEHRMLGDMGPPGPGEGGAGGRGMHPGPGARGGGGPPDDGPGGGPGGRPSDGPDGPDGPPPPE